MRAKRSRNGFALILILSFAAILLILVAAMFIESNSTLEAQQFQQALSLAMDGQEAARGYAQMQQYSSTPLEDANTAENENGQQVMSGTSPLYFASGDKVIFESVYTGNNPQAQGYPVTAPVYNSSGEQIGTQVVGYYAFVIRATEPIHVFAIGAVGSSPTNIYAVREIHAEIAPTSYGQYSYFGGNPSEQVAIFDNTLNRITNQPLSTNCPPPCSGATEYSADSYIPGGGSLQSFNKTYSASPWIAVLTGNNEITGLSGGDYYFDEPNSPSGISPGAFEVNQNTYLPAGGNSGLYTNQNSIGLPNCASSSSFTCPSVGASSNWDIPEANSNLSTIMSTLYTDAYQNGFFVYDSTQENAVSTMTNAGNTGSCASGSPTSCVWVPTTASCSSMANCTGSGWDPTNTSASSSNEVSITMDSKGVSTANGDSANCTSGSGNVMVTNTSAGNTLNYQFNGVSGSIAAGKSFCFSTASMNAPLIYVDGNMNVSANSTNGYNGNFSVVGPGQITVNGNMASQSFLSDSNFSSNTFSSSSSDVSALITPYQINLNPTVGNDFESSIVLEQLGSPGTLPACVGSGSSCPTSQESTWLYSSSTSLGGKSMYDTVDAPTDSACGGASPPIGCDFTIQVGPQGGGGEFPNPPTSNCPSSCMYGNIYLYGTQIQYNREGNWYNYYTNVYQPYDFNLLTTSPPFSPTISAGYQVVYWTEVNRYSGQDMRFNSP